MFIRVIYMLQAYIYSSPMNTHTKIKWMKPVPIYYLIQNTRTMMHAAECTIGIYISYNTIISYSEAV